MRNDDDNRHDYLVKSELADKYVTDIKNIAFALEDRTRVCQMWRDRGITCFQVKKGDY